jgi:ABC-2 type transport system permease protein
MKILQIALYNFKSLARNLKSAGIMFILPIVFMGIFAVAFGSGGDTRLAIGLVEADVSYYEQYEEVITELRSGDGEGESEGDEGSLVFGVEVFSDQESAEEFVTERDGILYVVPTEDGVEVYGEQTGVEYSAAASILQSVTAQFFQADTSYFQEQALDAQSQDFEVFTFLVPGLIVYGILILIPGIAQNFTDITEKRYIFRYFTSRASAIDIIGGSLIYQLVLALIQVVILYLTATMFGFEAEGNLLLALLVAVPTGVFVVGLGLLIGAFVRRTEAATNIGTIVSIILGFFSGSFIYGISRILEFEIFGQKLAFNDILPTKHATDALTEILIDAKGFSAITDELLIISISAILVLLLGVISYNKTQLSHID